MADIEFNCPHCSQSLTVDASGAGLVVPCPGCGQNVTVPWEYVRSPQKRAVMGILSGEQEGWTNDILFDCPACGEKLMVDREEEGKRIPCPKCHIDVIAPTPSRVVPSAVSVSETIGRLPLLKCPACGATLRQDDVMCLSCGLNFKTGERAKATTLPPPQARHGASRVTAHRSPAQSLSSSGTRHGYSPPYGSDNTEDSPRPKSGGGSHDDDNDKEKSWYRRHPWQAGIMMAIVVFLPQWHINTGSQGPRFLHKVSWSQSETFINYDTLMALPYVASKAQYPLTWQALERDGLALTPDEVLKKVTTPVPTPARSDAYEKGRATGQLYGRNDKQLDSYDHGVTMDAAGKIYISQAAGYQMGTDEYGDFWDGFKAGYYETR